MMPQPSPAQDVTTESEWPSDAVLIDSEPEFAIVEGVDVDDAFARGKAGDAIPLSEPIGEVPVNAPVLDMIRWYGRGLVIACHVERKWSRALFRTYTGWENADDAAIVLRFVAAAESGKIKPSPKFGHFPGRTGMILRSLTEPGEVLGADGSDGIGRVELGPNPEFTKVCARAFALVDMDELPPYGTAAVLELSKAAGSDLRRFLFFGRGRTVKSP